MNDTTDRVTAGPEARGPNTQGPEARGPNAQGPEARVPNAQGPNAQGPNARAPEARGPEAQGKLLGAGPRAPVATPHHDHAADAARAGLLGRMAAAMAAASVRRPALTLLISALLTLGAFHVMVTRFALDTDAIAMFPEDLPWRQAEAAMDIAFPHREDLVAIVIDGDTPDAAERAAEILAADLKREEGRRLLSVDRPGSEEFFRRSALLFPAEAKVREATERIIAAQAMLGTLAADPSLRGVGRAMELIAEGMEKRDLALDTAQVASALTAFAAAAEAAQQGRIAPVDWQRLFTGQAPEAMALRRFVLVRPQLDFSGLAPAAAATQAIREAVARLHLSAETGVRIRLTGNPVIRDEEFSTVFGGAIFENIVSLLAVASLLWLGLRSARLIIPMLVVLIEGLIITAAFGALAIGPYNPLSIAFAVLFIGLGVDFAIQYSVCLREQRHRLRDEPLASALVTAAAIAGPAIGLAALALCAGFLSFLPTDYRGLSELGVIAAAGMIIAVIASLTTLPALLAFTRPQEEQQPVGYAVLAPLDRFLQRRARGVVIATGFVALAAASCLPWLRFDTNPLNLRNPTTEAVSTFRDLMRDPETTPNTINILVPDFATAKAMGDRLEALPAISGTRSLLDFVPDDQAAKIALIRDAAELFGPTLDPPDRPAPPDAAESRAALGKAGAALLRAAGDPVAEAAVVAPARRLGTALQALAAGPDASIDRLRAALVPGLQVTLDGLRLALDPRPVTVEDLPGTLRRDWVAIDGRIRLEVRPTDLSDRSEGMGRFASAVLSVNPSASGPAISVQASARTILHAFLVAGLIATGLVVALLLAVLRSPRLAVLALAPLSLAGLMTLATCVLIGLPLNLANIIALPLLFAQGVAFKIYFVVAWQAGERSLLPSALTRAVLFSALTNGVAFGTLALSNHPGTAGMGVMLTLSLFFALSAVLLTLPSMLALFAADLGAKPRSATSFT